LIESPATAAEALRDYFLANADAGDHAANDELIAELVRRIRTHQASGDTGLHKVWRSRG
jgi:GGDEF domain-containing protein